MIIFFIARERVNCFLPIMIQIPYGSLVCQTLLPKLKMVLMNVWLLAVVRLLIPRKQAQRCQPILPCLYRQEKHVFCNCVWRMWEISKTLWENLLMIFFRDARAGIHDRELGGIAFAGDR